jgi:hypothetical protein
LGYHCSSAGWVPLAAALGVTLVKLVVANAFDQSIVQLSAAASTLFELTVDFVSVGACCLFCGLCM